MRSLKKILFVSLLFLISVTTYVQPMFFLSFFPGQQEEDPIISIFRNYLMLQDFKSRIVLFDNADKLEYMKKRNGIETRVNAKL